MKSVMLRLHRNKETEQCKISLNINPTRAVVTNPYHQFRAAVHSLLLCFMAISYLELDSTQPHQLLVQSARRHLGFKQLQPCMSIYHFILVACLLNCIQISIHFLTFVWSQFIQSPGNLCTFSYSQYDLNTENAC